MRDVRHSILLGLALLSGCSFSSSGSGQDGQPRSDAPLGTPDAVAVVPDAEIVTPDAAPLAACSQNPGGLLFCLPFGALLDQDNNLALDGSTNELNAKATDVDVADRLTVGDALSMDTASLVHVVSNAEFVVASTVSYGAWIRLTSAPAAGQRFVILDHNVAYTLAVSPTLAANCTVFNAPAGITSAAANDVPLNTWFHIACVATAETITVFLDGVAGESVSRSSATLLPGLGGLCVGHNCSDSGPTNGSGADALLGDLDNVKIWNRALSSDEICKEAKQIDCSDS